MKIETRGETTTLNNYMMEKTLNILKSSANMYGLECNITQVGDAKSADGSNELAQLVKQIGLNLHYQKSKMSIFWCK